MSFELNAVFSFTVGIGAVIGLIRIKKTDSAFLPFLFLLWIGFAHEVVSFFLIWNGYSNAVTYNCFVLLEAFILSFQFFKWGLFDGKERLFYFLQVFIAATWVIELFYRKGLSDFFSYFILLYSIIIVFMAIDLVSDTLFSEPGPPILQPKFLICMGLILYFVYTMLTEIFWIYGLNKSAAFRIRIYDLFGYINLFTNLLFAFATLWIPLKRRYILQLY